MKVVGLITEHNPFHNGHLYHLQQAKISTGADYVISVMSGNFLQRGEPALANKWARAKMAIQAGVDLVLELPAAFATRSAPSFAYGSVKTLDDCGLVDFLCFGSEKGEIQSLKSVAEVLTNEPPELSLLIKKYLSQGVIYPVAQNNALKEYLNVDLASIATSPNNILGIEYLKALLELKSSIKPVTIKRIKNNYHDEELPESHIIASATSIRQNLLKDVDKNKIEKYMPSTSFKILEEEFNAGRGPIFVKDMAQLILFSLRLNSSTLKRTLDVSEGLENRISQMAHVSTNYEDLINNIKNKRYTRTKLQRIMIHQLLNYSQGEGDLFHKIGPQYIRILAFNTKGQQLLAKMKKTAKVPLISHVAPYLKEECSLKSMLELDIKATNLYTLLYPNAEERLSNLDYLKKPLALGN